MMDEIELHPSTYAHRPRQATNQTSDTKSLSETLPVPNLAAPSSSSNTSKPLPATSLLTRLKSRTLRISRALAGPQNVQPLPDFQPLLTFTYTLPIYRPTQRWLPDLAFRRSYSSRLRRWMGPFKHGVLVGVFLAAWLVGFAFLVRANSFQSSTTPMLGDEVTMMTCTSTYWSSRNTCGLDGAKCSASGSLSFRCPSGCSNQILYNPRAVGAEAPYYVPLVIGGADGVYRADSFVCGSAVHSGAISDSKGGCSILTFVANHTSFPSSLSNGIQSINFPTTFPLGFEFSSVDSQHCKDLKDPILAFNVVMIGILMLLLAPGDLVVFWTLASVAFWHVVLISDQPNNPPVISEAFGDFLPAIFVFYFFHRTAFRFTLPFALLHAPIEAFILYSAGFWPGTLFNLVTAKVPIDTLTSGSFGDGAGGWVAALLVGIVLLVLNQIWVMWRTGWLPFYAKWTLAGVLVIVVLACLPDLTFRLHHYIFAILFMPALGFATRSSAVLQGLLLGIFADGVGKFGFDSILQTEVELRRDGALGSALPSFFTNSSTFANLTGSAFTASSVLWNPIPSDLSMEWDGFSLLVDDVERYSGAASNYSLERLDLNPDLPHYFRLAVGGTSGDYTKAASWLPNGTWINPKPGAS